MVEVFGYDIAPIIAEGGKNPFYAFYYIVKNGGFVVFYPVLVFFLWKYWTSFIWRQYMKGISYMILAVDVPRENEQSLKAVEQIFASISGPHQNFSFKEAYWDGEDQVKFSFEIASIGGYVQYYIYFEDRFRDTVEAAIYAQYPDAEITEVEDYMNQFPDKWPDPDHVMWGVEMVGAAHDVYPIKTYRMFEDSLTGTFADPMAALLELMSTLYPGENLVMQFMLEPIDHRWPKIAEKEVAKIVGAKIKEKKTLLDTATDTPVKTLQMVHDFIFSEQYEDAVKDERKEHNLMQYLTPGEKAILEAMQEKITKIAYKTRFRWMYMAENKYRHHRKAVNGGMFGAIKQFNTLDMNGFKPGKHSVTRAEYLFKDQIKYYRMRKLMANYKGREKDSGEIPMILNIEELATVWHFPTIGVMAPGVVQAEAKKAAAPTGLPLEPAKRSAVEEVVLTPQAQMKKAAAPPVVPRPVSPISEAAKREVMAREEVVVPAQPEVSIPEEDNSSVPPSNLPIG